MAVALTGEPPPLREKRWPTGTLTFLMTDIEGSTRLVLALGVDGWAPLLERHRALLRAAVAAEGGVEVQTEGDSLFAVFVRAPAAVAAATALQRALAAEPWPDGAAIKVRTGLHTGEGQLDADDSYIGADVHRAARVAGAAHGGQVLLSDATRALVTRALPDGVRLIDLGEHRLKDLRSEHLYQLDITGLPCKFPPLKSLDARPNNLPTQLTSFIGRDRELQDVSTLLEKTRLLTLSGPGGTGKTRLALQLAAISAENFPDGVWMVALEPIVDPALVASTIARTLGVQAAGDASAAVIAQIGNRKMLLVLDNFEQVVAGAPVVNALLAACPELRVVATSRAVLRIRGEQEYQVPGLPAPPDTSRLSQLELENLTSDQRAQALERFTQYEAVRLFIARAMAVRPEFAVTNENAPAVAQICAELHGMPLAIELAAARIKLLNPAQILARLGKQLTLLTSGARDVPARQQTLRGAIAWSYDLLDGASRRFLDRLSIFSGGWDLEAAEAVTGQAELGVDVFEALGALVDQSLVRREESRGEIRFDLFPTIREFAAEMLAARGETPTMAAHHMRYFCGLAEEAAPQLSGGDQRRWLDRLEHNHDNFRAAIASATALPDPDAAVRLGFALWRFWQQRGYLNEARATLSAMEARKWNLPPMRHARLLEALGGIAYWQGDPSSAVVWYDAALAIWRAAGDRREIANGLYNRIFGDVMPILLSAESPDIAPSLAMAEEALAIFRETGDRAGEGNLLWTVGNIYFFARRPAEAEPWYERSLALFRVIGNRTMEAWSLHMISATVLLLGRTEAALVAAQEALRHFHEVGDLAGITLVLDDLVAVALTLGQKPLAGRLYGAARKLGDKTGAALGNLVDELFQARTRPKVGLELAPEDLARTSAEGAALSLDQVVRMALAPPTEWGGQP